MSDLQDYTLTWARAFKSSLDYHPETWKTLLSDFEFAPVALGKESIPHYRPGQSGKGGKGGKGQPLAVGFRESKDALAYNKDLIREGEMSTEYKRYCAFYNQELRVASPICPESIDKWFRGDHIGENKFTYTKFDMPDYYVPPTHIKRSAMGDSGDVDWNSWNYNSMCLPAKNKGPHEKRENYFWREVLCISFPAFAWLMGQAYTGREVIEAWKLLPMVKGTRPNGSNRSRRGH